MPDEVDAGVDVPDDSPGGDPNGDPISTAPSLDIATSDPADAPPPPLTAAAPDEHGEPGATPGAVLLHPQPPRPGDLSIGWRTITASLWLAVVLALAGVWNASVQLGLSTWWLGPRADPQPRFVQFSPFVAPVLMLLGAVNHIRRIAWFGIIASLITAAVGLGDLDRVTRLAVVEILVGVVALVISIASLTGTYRAPDHSSSGR